MFGPPRQIICAEEAEFTSHIVQAFLDMLNCKLKVISPYNHGSSKVERQIKTVSDIIFKHLWDKGQMWPLFTTTAAYVMNTFSSEALNSFSPFQLVFVHNPSDLTSLSFSKVDTIPVTFIDTANEIQARFHWPIYIDTTLNKTHYRLKDATGLLLDSTYHVNHIKKGSAHTPQGIVNTFYDYEKALKNTLLNKSAIESPHNKF